MIGLVVVTHGRLAQELIAAVNHIVGVQENLVGISLFPDDDLDQKQAEITAALKQVDGGQGVILLTDMFGGTPSNLAIGAMDAPLREVLAGVNLPILVKLVELRHTGTLRDVAYAAREAGRKHIHVVSELLDQPNKAKKG